MSYCSDIYTVAQGVPIHYHTGILSAERAVLKHPGGIVLRLAALYTFGSGAHHIWLSGKIKESASNPDGLINLVHYDDAARAVVSAFKGAAAEPQLQVF